ncbi:hypothetical protein U8D42_12755 [Mycobacterium europaeum]|uniref:hypothetical protein n=1 Tax=Mycobacterium europaeum TaxID=761804 RepID=UPI002AE0AA9F|nr:hypothetical protein [Mycobacterium europaeum]MEA1160664.1 hypothetical protein [Mycobacterium europaeum]
MPVTVDRGGVSHVVGWGRAFIDHKGNPRIRGLWSTTPMGEYVKTLVTQRVVSFANVDLEASIDGAGARVYQVVGASFSLPVDPPPAPDDAAGDDLEPAAELLGLAARIYAAPRAERPGLAERVIACAVALRDTSA